ncbi:MAG TPA: glycoside hydrolase family 28 protein [Longimicrobiaceae bacterium]
MANTSNISRRDFLRAAIASSALVLPISGAACARDPRSGSTGAESRGWDRVPEILARIRPPVFPQRDFLVTEFGAVGDGERMNTDAIRRAIEACHAAGGGRVVIPEGRFLTGPIHLLSQVNLHVAEGATLAFSQNPDDFLPLVFTRWEGVELMNYSPLIYAFEQENVAVTGAGVLDGQANSEVWWPWKGQGRRAQPGGPHQDAARDRLFRMAAEAVPVEQRRFGPGSYLRPNFVQPYRCRNVLIEGITVRNSPMWELHPVLCENVTVRGVRIESHGPNNDGCDPESCRDVLIEDCYFDTGDDCIALKSGRNEDGRRLATPIENVIVRNCHMKDGHGGVTIGSEISGGARHIFAENCRMDSPNLERGLRLKTNARRGGVIEEVYMRNCTVGQVSNAVLSIDFFYEEGREGEHLPVVRAVEMRDVTSEHSTYPVFLRGFEDKPIESVRIVDCHFNGAERESVVENVAELLLENVTVNGVEWTSEVEQEVSA